jgi:hypothetical protein
LRLDRRFRWAIYTAVAVLLATGVAWIAADALKDWPAGATWSETRLDTSAETSAQRQEIWQQVAANLLMWHGGASMVMLMLLGALVALHIAPAWRARRNRVSGGAMTTINAVLVVTAFGLYYLGSDEARAWCRAVHIGFGLALPALFLVHLWFGRRRVKMTGGPREIKCLNRF